MPRQKPDQGEKNGSFSLIERVILSAGAMLIFSVSSAPLRGGWTGAAGRAHARLAAPVAGAQGFEWTLDVFAGRKSVAYVQDASFCG